MRKHSVDLQKPKGRELKHNSKENHQATKGNTKSKKETNTKSTGKQGLKWQYIHIYQ